MSAVRVTILADNCATGRATRGEHGLSMHLAFGDRRILFDTGQGMVIADNARALGLDLAQVDTIVFSHGHYDHTGGLPAVMSVAREPIDIYLHPAALEPKYHVTSSGARPIGIPEAAAALRLPNSRLRLASEPVEIAPGIRTTGQIPRDPASPPPGETYHLDPCGEMADPLLDDQSLFFDTPGGLVVLLGCAHAGLVAILEHIRQLTGNRPLHAVIGGMHLGSATPDQLEALNVYLRQLSPALLVPLHCTGARACASLWTAFPEACCAGGVGVFFDFDLSAPSEAI